MSGARVPEGAGIIATDPLTVPKCQSGHDSTLQGSEILLDSFGQILSEAVKNPR
jgi:hypothetical protein